MKKIFHFTIALVIFSLELVSAQTSSIQLNQFYKYPEAANNCSLKIKITQKSGMTGTMMINQKTYQGILKRNPHNEEPTYNFYYNKSNKKAFLMLQFTKEQNCYQLTIINQEYNRLFKPCFDEKYITLSSCN